MKPKKPETLVRSSAPGMFLAGSGCKGVAQQHWPGTHSGFSSLIILQKALTVALNAICPTYLHPLFYKRLQYQPVRIK